MKQWWKWAAAGAGVLLTPVLLVAIVAFYLDEDEYKSQLSDAVLAATGRPLIIAGELKLGIGGGGLKPQFHAADIRYPNPEWATKPWAIEVERAVATVDLWALLHGTLRVEEIRLARPKISVEKNAAGVYNLAVLRAQKRESDAPQELPWGLEVARASVTGGEILVATKRRDWHIKIADARARSRAPGAPVTLQFRGAVQDVAVDASAQAGSLRELLTFQPAALSVDGTLGDAENSVRAVGTVDDLLKWRGVDLALDFDIARPETLSKLAGVSVPKTGLVSGRARLLQPGRVVGMALRDVQLRGEKWGVPVIADGEIARAFRRDGIDFRITADGDLDAKLPTWLSIAAGFGGTPIRGVAAARLHGSTRDLRLVIASAEASVNMTDGTAASISTAGEIAYRNREWHGVLPVTLSVQPGESASVLSSVGALNATANLSHDGGWRLDEVQLAVAREALQIHLAGALTGFAAGRFDLTANATDGEFLAPLFNDSVPPMSDLKLQTEVEFSGGEWRADVKNVSATIAGATVSASGDIAELHRFGGIDLAVSGRAKSLSALPFFAGRSLPESGAVRVDARLRDDDSGVLHLGDITASVVTTDDTMTVTAAGAIENLGANMNADINIDLTLRDAEAVRPLFADADFADKAMPFVTAMSPLMASAKLSSVTAGDWRIGNLSAASSATDSPITWTASGDIPLTDSASGSDINMRLALTDADALRPFFTGDNADKMLPNLSAITPLTVAGNLYSPTAGDWRIRNLTATAPEINANASGEITNLSPLTAQLHADIKDATVAVLPADWNIPRPRDAMLNATFDVAINDDKTAVTNLVAVMKSEDANLTLHGEIPRLNPFVADEVRVKFDAADVAALNWKFLAGLKPDNPIAGEILLTPVTDSSDIKVNAEIKIGDNDVRGDGLWQTKTPPRFDANLTAERLDLREILTRPPKKTRFFSDAKMNTNWIRNLNGRIKLTAKNAGNHLLRLRDLRAELLLENGQLTHTIAGKMGQGEARMEIKLDTNSGPAAATFIMHGDALATEGLVAYQQDDFLQHGTFDADINIKTRGDSMAALAAHADGKVLLRLHDAQMKNQSLEFIGGDIFSNLVTIINPFRSIGESIAIECSVLRFNIADGMATSDNGLAMKTDRVTLLGGGDIDLTDESLKILISPKARKGFGINPSSLAKMVRLGGTLADPKFEADGSRLFESAATVWAALYSGGLSLIAKGLLDRTKANADVCGLVEE